MASGTIQFAAHVKRHHSSQYNDSKADKTMPTTQVIIEQFTSRVLADNPLGDPATRQLPIILPPDYESSDKRYPVIYGLTGFTGSGLSMLNFAAWQPNLPQRIDRLMADGKLPPAIYVLPDCFTRYGGSQYLNSTAIGRYEDYVIDEIVPHIDRTYRTIAGPEGRGVFGKSSGGYGAIMLGLQHPDVFGAVACHSGDMAFDLCYRPDFPKFVNAIQQAGGVEKWWIEFERKVKKEGRDYRRDQHSGDGGGVLAQPDRATAPDRFSVRSGNVRIETGRVGALAGIRSGAAGRSVCRQPEALAPALHRLRLARRVQSALRRADPRQEIESARRAARIRRVRRRAHECELSV